MEIATPRLILREFTAGDLPALAAIEADPLYREFYGPQETGPDFTRSLLERFLAWAAESPRLNYQLAIARREDPGTAIGTCGIRLQGCEPGVAEFGLGIAAEHWGQGCASEAARAILELAFRDLGLREVRGITVTENPRVQRLVTRLGFTKVETRPGPGWMQERGWSHTEWRFTKMRSLLPGELAWYVTGRFYLDAEGTIRDMGYFLHIQGIAGDLFSGEPGESTAYFTFASSPFRADTITNGDLTIGLDRVGEFSLYLNREPGATFEDPLSFAAGERIALFRRKSVVAGVTVGDVTPIVSANVFSATLLWSKEFEFGGRVHDLRPLMPHGVTQWGTASTTPVPTSGFTKVVPFVGSAVAIGT